MRVGWFLLKDGRRAYLFSTSSKNLLVVTKDGRRFLLSPHRFDEFVKSVDRHVARVEGAA